MIGMTLRITMVALVCLGFTGCTAYTSRFSPPVEQTTEIKFKENDFQHIESNLRGEAEVWYILWSIPMGDNRLFSRALAQLYSGAEGKMTGRASQLVNWTLDETDLDFFVLGIHRHKVIFRADLIEYVK